MSKKLASLACASMAFFSCVALCAPNFSTVEKNILLTLVEEDMANYFEGESDNFIGGLVTADMGPFVSTTINEISSRYERNEIDGDNRYKDKLLFARSCVITSIDSGLTGEPMVSCKPAKRHSFHEPTLRFKESKNLLARIGDLAPGQKIHVFCIGDGETMRTPFLRNCQFADDFLAKYGKKAGEWYLEQDKFYKGVIKTTLMLTTAEAKACSRGVKDCFKVIKKLAKTGAINKRKVKNIDAKVEARLKELESTMPKSKRAAQDNGEVGNF